MIGLVNSAQTYWGLEIDIMQMTPRASCTHLDFRGLVLAGAALIVVVLILVSLFELLEFLKN
jgi:hypothetical protein